MTRVWLLTGASRGLGRAIAETVLAAGDRLLAGVRDPQALADLANRYPETLSIAALDVTDAAAAETAVQAALDPGDMTTATGVAPWACDPEAAERLWALSETLTGARLGILGGRHSSAICS